MVPGDYDARRCIREALKEQLPELTAAWAHGRSSQIHASLDDATEAVLESLDAHGIEVLGR